MCASLASEICTGVNQKAGVCAWLDKMLEEVWLLSWAKEAWMLIETSQPVQIRRERLAKMEKVKEYWGRRRLEAQVEAGRGQI